MTATRTKRILSVQPVCDGGGSEHALIRMIRQLAADGWECHVAVPAPARLADEYAAVGAILHVVPMTRLTGSGDAMHWVRYAISWPVTVARLIILCRRIGATVVHSNSLHSWHGWAAAAVVRRPHVWHAREIVFQSAAALRIERWLASHFADVVIAVSHAVAAQLDPHNVVVVTDEAGPDFRPDRAGMFRAASGIPDDTPLVGSIARIDTWKGFDVLLDAVPLIRDHRPDAEVLIAGATVPGKEDYAARLRSRADGLGVRWLGPRDDVAELMADLDVFAQVSTEPEPFGLVVVEALASGVPVVAGNQGGPLEILGPGSDIQAGHLVDPGDAHQLAAAVLDLLPPHPSSAASRASRKPIRTPSGPGFSEVFDPIVSRTRRSPGRGRPGTGRSTPG